MGQRLVACAVLEDDGHGPRRGLDVLEAWSPPLLLCYRFHGAERHEYFLDGFVRDTRWEPMNFHFFFSNVGVHDQALPSFDDKMAVTCQTILGCLVA